jgi:hypothetical protein
MSAINKMKSFAVGFTGAALVACVILAIVETYRIAGHAVALARDGIWQPIALASCMVGGIAWAARKLWAAAVEE